MFVKNDWPPVLLLGGMENSLSIVRSLGKRGIRVFVAAKSSCFALRSRFCARKFVIPKHVDSQEYWYELLLSRDDAELQGCVVFVCGDDAVNFIASNKSLLEPKYLLEEQDANLRLAMLNKQKTAELGRSVGVPTPSYWEVKSTDDISGIESMVNFPAIIKPLYSHLFQRVYKGKKYLRANDLQELRVRCKKALDYSIEIVVCELIPGPDDLLSSYYTFLDDNGQSLFHFTKRVIRRSPVNEGGGSYHITEWLPETAKLGRRFFEKINYRGLGNIEFKKDIRDGNLKLIEVNARFTAAQELLVRAGLDIAYIIYCHTINRKVPEIKEFRNFVRLWYPERDFDAFRELHAKGELSWGRWIRSIAHKQTLPYFNITDPWPAIAHMIQEDGKRLRRKLRL